MAIDDRPVTSAILYNEDGTDVFTDGLMGTENVASRIARGVVTGAAGYNGGYVGTSATSTVFCRASTWADPGTADQVEFLSSSNQDGAAGNQGTLTLRFIYYDGSMNGPFTEDITMNGTSAVSSVATNVRFLEKMYSLTVGSNGTNVGTITCRRAGGGDTLGQIATSDGATFWAHHMVGAGRTSFITAVSAGITGTLTGAQVIPRTLDPFTSNAFETPLGAPFVVGSLGGSTTFTSSSMIVTGPQIFLIRVRPESSSSGTTFVNLSFYDL